MSALNLITGTIIASKTVLNCDGNIKYTYTRFFSWILSLKKMYIGIDRCDLYINGLTFIYLSKNVCSLWRQNKLYYQLESDYISMTPITELQSGVIPH